MYRRILDFFFVFVLFEGVVRKWIAPEFSLQIQFTRDLLPTLALIVYFAERHRAGELSQVRGPQALFLFSYVVWCGCAVLVSVYVSEFPLVVAAVGVRTHFSYLPLLLLIPPYLGTWSRGLHKLIELMALGAAIFLFSFFQFTQPIDSVWNVYSDPEFTVASFAWLQKARVTGTFSYITGFSQFSALCGSIAFAFFLLKRRGRQSLLFPGVVFVLSIGAIFASGSRGPLLFLFVSCIAILMLSIALDVVSSRRIFVVFLLTISLCVATIYFMKGQLQAFIARVEAIGGSDVESRIYDHFLQWLNVMLQNPYGLGLGSGHQALMDIVVHHAPELYEVELTRIAFEMGVGVVIYLCLKLSIVLHMLRGARSAVGANQRVMLILCVVVLPPLIVLGSVYQPVGNIAFWSIGGFGYWLMRLERRARPGVRLRCAVPGGVYGGSARSSGH